MSDRDVIVRAESLDKTYRLYAKPHYRFLDMFGLLRKTGVYTEHAALHGINLEIRRGEKVAFIGRNGAGKSTLLKLITGVIEPSAGSLQVSQGAHALLQIGSGFHQDFTGRQNALAYLAHLGVSGKDAEKRLVEIIDFAELEAYIDQPIKTYSTGMVARLMFATSTVIEPELLVLDEILGVGDAYFSQKSFERIREMCEAHGTTVLLVSHDIYSAAKLCDRMIWIDQGQLVFDGPSKEAMKAYEMSIREQEEKRLRAKNATRKLTDAAETEISQVFMEWSSPAGLSRPVLLRSLEISWGEAQSVQRSLGKDDDFVAISGLRLIQEYGNWGDVVSDDGVLSRAIRPFGSPFQKSAAVIHLPEALPWPQTRAQVTFECKGELDEELVLVCYDQAGRILLGKRLKIIAGRWLRFAGDLDGQRNDDGLALFKPIGAGNITVRDVSLVDTLGRLIYQIAHGDPMRLLIRCRIHDRDLDEHPHIVVAFHRNGTQEVARFIAKDLRFDGAHESDVVISFMLPRLNLSAGSYSLTILIAKEGYFDKFQGQYFTINPDVYACRSRCLDFDVVKDTPLSAGTGFVGEAQWNKSAAFESTSENDMNSRGENIEINQLLHDAQALADCKDAVFCPGWSLGLDILRGGRFVRERMAIVERLQKLKDIPSITMPWLEGLDLSLSLQGDFTRCLYVGGSYDPNEFATLKAVMQPGMVAVDVGANMGLYSLFLAKKVGLQGEVWSFEPSSRDRERLLENVQLNELGNIRVFAAGLGKSDTEEQLFIADDSLPGHNSFHGVQQAPIIRVRVGQNPHHWNTGWSGAKVYEVAPGEDIEFYLYRETAGFSYEIVRASLGASLWVPNVKANPRNNLQELHLRFPQWDVSFSDGLEIEISETLKVRGGPNDYLSLTWRNQTNKIEVVQFDGILTANRTGLSESVPVYALDNLAARENLPALDLLKIDVEGLEYDVLLGARHVIDQFKPFILLEFAKDQYPQACENISSWLLSLGYVLHEFAPESGRLRQVEGMPGSPNLFAAPASRLGALIGVMHQA